MEFTHLARRATLVVASIPFLLSVGCRPALEQSPAAEALPAVRHLFGDDADDGTGEGLWPGWRGASRDGVADDQTLPLTWSDAEGYRWKTSVPGAGNSSPVVWGDSVYLTSAVGENPPRAAVLCFSREDGQLQWQTEVAALEDRTHVKNGHASASVATDGERVFAFFGSAGLFCFDPQGRQLWQAELGDLGHVWGTASSPVLYGDLVIQLCDNEQDSYVATYDRNSGEQVWRTPRDSYGSWSTPVFVEAERDDGETRDELVINGTGTSASGGGWVIAYDPATGEELWRVQGTTDIVTPTAIVHAGLVISTSGRNGPTLAIRPGGSGDVTSSHVVWKLRRGGAYVPTGVGYGNRLYTVSDGGVAASYNVGNGEVIWRERLPGTFTSSLIAGAGRIYATNERGTVYVLAADDTYSLLATNAMNERCLTTPAVSRGELLLRTEGHLYCITGTDSTKHAILAGETGDADVRTDQAVRPAAAEMEPSGEDSGVEAAAFTSPSESTDANEESRGDRDSARTDDVAE